MRSVFLMLLTVNIVWVLASP